MSSSMINRFVGAIDQGTSSTKFVVYNHGCVVYSSVGGTARAFRCAS